MGRSREKSRTHFAWLAPQNGQLARGLGKKFPPSHPSLVLPSLSAVSSRWCRNKGSPKPNLRSITSREPSITCNTRLYKNLFFFFLVFGKLKESGRILITIMIRRWCFRKTIIQLFWISAISVSSNSEAWKTYQVSLLLCDTKIYL